MYLYNTLTRKKEKFVSIHDNTVKIYTCGPTVYNYIHIGNARPLCVFDVLRRYLEEKGYKVRFIQNFTDIDDKIINRATKENSDYFNISEKYIEEYKIDANGLNVREATVHPRATENIEGIIEMISTLINKGFAYYTDNGDVYFKMKSFKDYGKLSKQSIDELKSGARVEVENEKRDVLDFALWKAIKPNEPYWESPWGKGRPGWHIECSAMAAKYLGETIDIHCGGQDLIFPHHENEIAQSECCNGAKFANYWLHNGYINVDNKKMSKSLGNFFTVRDVAKLYGYEPIRYLMISSHYRSPINYSEDIIKQCKLSLDRLYNFKENLEFLIGNLNDNCVSDDSKIENELNKSKNKFYEAMDDDLNTADALAVIFELVRYVNTNVQNGQKISSAVLKKTLNLFNELTNVLGILYNKSDKIDDSYINELIELRNKARKNKDWAEADRIRDVLRSKNVVIEDTPNGVKWKLVNK